MEKYIKRKSRKDYICDSESCGRPIKKGEYYWSHSIFYPKDSIADLDINVYWRNKLCLKCHYTQDECSHEHVETSWSHIAGEEWRYEPDYDYCIDCGKVM